MLGYNGGLYLKMIWKWLKKIICIIIEKIIKKLIWVIRKNKLFLVFKKYKYNLYVYDYLWVCDKIY